MSAKKVVIVGGGPAGIELAKRLDSHAQVTLVDGKDCFVHSPAAIRAVTDSALLDKLIIPYSNLLKQGTIVQGWVERIDPDGVVLADGKKLAADITVVATGSSYAAPFKPARAGLDEYRAASEGAAAAVLKAGTIAVVGAGPVGAELAGEIAQAYPAKEVHLITDETSLFPQYTPKLAKKMLADFSSLGVHVHTGKRVENLESVSEPYAGTVILPLGPSLGATVLPFGKQGMAEGHWLTSRMKGRDLFITKRRELLGQD